MMYLTIQKYCPVSRSRIILKKVSLTLIFLVVPLAILAAWLLISVQANLNFAQAAIGSDQSDIVEEAAP